MAKRMRLSEHLFETIKRAMGFDYFLLRGMRKATGKFALMCLGYNIKRAKKSAWVRYNDEIDGGGIDYWEMDILLEDCKRNGKIYYGIGVLWN